MCAMRVYYQMKRVDSSYTRGNGAQRTRSYWERCPRLPLSSAVPVFSPSTRTLSQLIVAIHDVHHSPGDLLRPKFSTNP